MRTLVFILLIALVVGHQDFWWWDTAEPMVLGFIPIGLAYHCFLSLAAGAVWWLAAIYCWPRGLDAADDPATPASTAVGGHR